MRAPVPHSAFSNEESPGLLANTEGKALSLLKEGSCEKIQLEGGKSLSRCPGEGQIYAAKTRREIDAREALPRLPPSDVGNLAIFL